jgi:hypothetical protein
MATFMFPKLRKELSRRVYPFHLSANKPVLFSSRREFLKFLSDLKSAESIASVESETQDNRGAAKTLLYIFRTPDRLVSRETIYEKADVNAEILSGGGLRIDVRSPEKSWDNVKSYFRQFQDYLREDGKSATLTTLEWEDHRPVIRSALLKLGILSVKIGDIRGELHCDLSERSCPPVQPDLFFGFCEADIFPLLQRNGHIPVFPDEIVEGAEIEFFTLLHARVGEKFQDL